MFAALVPILFVAQSVGGQSPPTQPPTRILVVSQTRPEKDKLLLASDGDLTIEFLGGQKLVRRKTERFDFLIESDLWNPARIKSSIAAFRALASIDLRHGFQLKALPEALQPYIGQQLGSIAKQSDKPVITSESTVSAYASVSYKVKVGEKTKEVSLDAKPTGAPTRQSTDADNNDLGGNLEITPSKFLFHLETPLPLSDAKYWLAFQSASRELLERRQYWEKMQREAEAALVKSQFPDLYKIWMAEDPKTLANLTPAARDAIMPHLLRTGIDINNRSNSLVVQSVRKDIILSVQVSKSMRFSMPIRVMFDFP